LNRSVAIEDDTEDTKINKDKENMINFEKNELKTTKVNEEEDNNVKEFEIEM